MRTIPSLPAGYPFMFPQKLRQNKLLLIKYISPGQKNHLTSKDIPICYFIVFGL